MKRLTLHLALILSLIVAFATPDFAVKNAVKQLPPRSYSVVHTSKERLDTDCSFASYVRIDYSPGNCYGTLVRKNKKIMPVSIANPKLSKVPINIYSVRLLSFALDKSPNLNTDFAASKKPIPSQ